MSGDGECEEEGDVEGETIGDAETDAEVVMGISSAIRLTLECVGPSDLDLDLDLDLVSLRKPSC